MKIKLGCFPASLAIVSQLLAIENWAKFQANLGGIVGQCSSIRKLVIWVIQVLAEKVPNG
jgi:hypothetical protein